MAQNKGYMAKIGLDTSDVDKQLRSLSKELKQIDSSLRDNGDNAVLNAQRYTVLQKQLAETTEKLTQLKQAEDRMQEALKNEQISASEYRNYQREVENTTRKIELLNEELRRMDENGGVTDRVIQQREEKAREEAKLAAEQMQNLAQGLDEIGDKANATADAIANAVINTLKTAGTQIANLTQQATSLYGEYQQLVGGVETLFGDDAATVIENADNAFKTAGVSANEYMETATSFAASLVSSLDGNTKKAAASVDIALQDMADNANKMGTSMQSIQSAYQGFAKQNYTMLDNLKLGYGGTKTEMERLLADAEKLSGVHYDISSLDDIINAIHVIQGELKITGTTAKEAGATITGSAASMKAAWENLLTAMADPEGGHDLEQMVNDFVDTAITSIDNMMPSIEAALLGMGDVLEKLAPIINEKVPQLIDDIMPSIITAVSTLTNVAIETIADAVPMILDAVKDLMSELWDNTDGAAKAIVALVTGTWAAIKGIGIAADIGKLVVSIQGAGGLTAAVGTMKAALTTDLIPALAGVSTSVIALTGYVAALAAAFIAAEAAAKWLDEEGDNLLENAKYLNGFTDASNDALEAYTALAEKMRDDPLGAGEYAAEHLEEDTAKLEKYTQELEETKAKIEELEQMRVDDNANFLAGGFDQELEGLKTRQEELETGIQVQKNLVHEEEKAIENQKAVEEEAAADAARRWSKYSDQQEEAARRAKENAGKSSADMVKEIEEGRDAELAAEEEKWDAKYKWDKKNAEDYWTERKAYLETHKNNTEAWWSAWREVENHEQSKLEEEQKAREQAQKEQEQAAKEAAAAEKTALQKAYSDISHTAKMNDYDQGWILEQQKTYLDNLDKSSDLYKEYIEKWEENNKDWQDKLIASREQANKDAISSAKKLSDEIVQQFKTQQQTTQTEIKSLIDEGKKAAEKLISEYQSGQQSIMKSVNKPEKVTDIQGNERLIFTDFQDKLKELKQYQKNLDKLGELGLSDEHLQEIFSMDLDTRMLYIKELLKMSDSNRQAYLTDYENYRAAAYNTAQTETKLSGKGEELMQESINTALDDISDNSYIKGKEAAERWMQGFADAGGSLEDAVMLEQQLTAASGTGTAETNYTGSLTINVAGTQAIKTTIADILAAMRNSGGVLNV